MTKPSPDFVDWRASAEARQVLGELRSEMRNTRKVLREIAEERRAVQLMVRSAVTEEVNEAVREQIGALSELTQRQMAKTADRITRKFDELAGIMLRGDKRPGRTSGLDLEQTIRQRAGENGE